MEQKPSTPRLSFTIAEACESLGIGEWALRGLIRRGDLPVVKLGGRVVIRRVDLEKVLESNLAQGKELEGA